MSDLISRLKDAERLCADWSFFGSQRAINDAIRRIAELEAEVSRVQTLHEGLMKNADQMNDELRTELHALKVGAGRYRAVVAMKPTTLSKWWAAIRSLSNSTQDGE